MNKKSYIMQFVESSLELPEENRMEAESLIMEMLPAHFILPYRRHIR